ncbi:probable disease resistance RPP8-like protein 2 isoform X1 [Fagus crenata]
MSREKNVESVTTIISSFLEQVDFVLTKKFLSDRSSIWVVEQVREDIKCLCDLLKGVKEVDEREKVWMEWVREICIPANEFLTSFVGKRQQQIKRWAKLKAPTFLRADLELKTKMKSVRSRIQYAYGRRWIYGMGESDEKEGLKPSSSRAFELESIWRDLRLMRALLKDVEGMEDQSQRVGVWLKQMEGLDLELEALNTCIQPLKEKMKGGLARPLLVLKELTELRSIETKIKEISRKFLVMSERKKNYDIGKFEGKWGQCSRTQDLPGTSAYMSDVIDKNDDNNLEEAQPGSTQQYGEIEEISNMSERKRNYDMGKSEGKRVQCSTVQDLPETSASMSDVNVINVDNQLEKAQPGSSQQDTETKRYKGKTEEEVESIKAELELIEAFLKDVEAIKEPDARLKFWEEEMRDTAHEVEAIIASATYESSISKYMGAKHKVVREISMIKKKIQEFTERRIAYGIEHVEASTSMTQRRYWIRPPSQCSEEFDVIGFEDHVYEIKERLLTPNEPHIISIVGMEGLGKTTLADSIYNAIKHDNAVHFKTYAWWSVEDKLKKMLHDFLKEKRYLIVLDDIPMARVWDNLKDAFPDESNGSRIVITTRDMAVPPDLESKIFQYKLQLLSTDESWTLFTNTLGMEVPQELEKLFREKVMSCGGLPLAIINMGKLLSKKVATDEEWSRVLNEKEDTGPWSEIFEKVSMELPLELNRCLHYFLLFPEEFEIPARRLITLWIAEGFFRLGRSKESPEHFAEWYLNELIDQNMVQVTKKKQNGKVRTCRLPGALRILLSKAREDKISKGKINPASESSSTSQVTKEEPNGKVRTCPLPGAFRKLLSKAMEDKISKGKINTASKSSSSNHLQLWIVDNPNNTDASNTSSADIHGDNTDTAILQASYRKSLSFLSFDGREGSQPGEEVGNFLDRCISYGCLLFLRVLDLERVFRPQLPKVLSKLAVLRYLGLRWTYLESLPSSISKLMKLQTLDLKHTYISTLPCSIWKMQQLRHLYLSESFCSRFEPPPTDASLANLQTLWGAFVDEKSPVKGGLDTLVNLRKLGVACRCMSNQEGAMTSRLKAVANWINNLTQLQSLRLKSHDKNNDPADLHLNPLSEHKELSSGYFLGRLKTPSVISKFPVNLIELTLSASALTEVDDPMQQLVNLPKLRILRLFSESYVGGSMCCPKDSFPQLRVLKLWKLEKLEKWTVQEGALSRLRDLEIRSCPLLESICCPKDSFPQLQVLKLWELEKLEWIVEEGTLSRLRDLEIRSCPLLESLCCPKDSFPQLQVLKLWELEKLEKWIVEEGALSRLRDLQIRSCPLLESMCFPKDSFPQLQVLKLWKLEKLEIWIVEEGALSRLRDLEIRSCARLQKLPDGLQHVKTLQELKLSNMPREFTERIKDSNSEDWGKIEHVPLVIIEP